VFVDIELFISLPVQVILIPHFKATEKRPRINIFKPGSTCYFKQFFDAPNYSGRLSHSMRDSTTGSKWQQ